MASFPTFKDFQDFTAIIYQPPCQCADCHNAFYLPEEQRNPLLSFRGRISDVDARRIAAQHVQDMQRERVYLQQRLASHGDLILSRWKKKSVEKRHALLIDACPDLYEHRWVYPRWYNTPLDQRWYPRTKAARSQFLLPWLSVEVLKTNPAVLFGLLHSRTVYPPQDWAAFDNMQLILGWAGGYFEVQFTEKCVVMYGPRYGEVVDWQAGPAHRADIMGFPRARLVLEAQADLMIGLRQIVDKILEGIDLDKPGTSEKWRSVTSLGFKQTGTVELWSPYTNQAFTAPPFFDVNSLISIVQTRMEAASDHLWLLQTDPAYTRRYIRIVFQGEFSQVAKPYGGDSLVLLEIYRDIWAYWFWRWVGMELEHVKSVHDRFRDSVHPGERLPPQYDRALGALELLLVNLVKHSAKYLSELLPERPGFCHRWSFKSFPDAAGNIHLKYRRTSLLDTKELFFEDPLEWCLVQMQGEPDDQKNFDHAMLFAFLDCHLANSTPKERARIDEVLYRRISDLAAYHEMLVSVRLHRPQNAFRSLDDVKKSEGREAWRGFNVPKVLGLTDAIRLGTPLLKEFYEAPLPGGLKDATWLKRSQAIRKALEAFWTGMRGHCHKILEDVKFSPKEVLANLETISAHLSAEYIEAVRTEEAQTVPGFERASDPLQRVWGSSTSSKPAVPVSKPKVKTRQAQQTEELPGIEDGVAGITLDSAEASSPVLPVTKRAFAVFTLMFSATAHEAAKTVEWDNFVYAMSDVGFSARNGGGSAVIFENETMGRGGRSHGKIVFHRPHPVAKIDPIMLHSMGRRMAKWFGWSRELFALE